jgi:predicted phage tail component-like protein
MNIGVNFNEKNSFADFGITIADGGRNFPMPQLKTITETVPYMNGEYDFTFMNGEGYYNRRKIGVTFNVIGKDWADAFDKRVKIVSWLLSRRGGELTFDDMPDYTFTDVSANISEELNVIGRRAVQLNVEFSAYPYMFAKDFGERGWDSLKFTDDDYLNVLSYSIPGGYVFYSYADHEIQPFLTFIKSGSSSLSFVLNGKTFVFSESAERFKREGFILKPGANGIIVSGSGTLKITAREEVL